MPIKICLHPDSDIHLTISSFFAIVSTREKHHHLISRPLFIISFDISIVLLGFIVKLSSKKAMPLKPYLLFNSSISLTTKSTLLARQPMLEKDDAQKEQSNGQPLLVIIDVVFLFNYHKQGLSVRLLFMCIIFFQHGLAC